MHQSTAGTHVHVSQYNTCIPDYDWFLPASGDDLGERESEGALGQEEEGDEDEAFPLKKLESLDEQLGRSKWVVPVRPKDELEMLLRAGIRLARAGGHPFSLAVSLS